MPHTPAPSVGEHPGKTPARDDERDDEDDDAPTTPTDEPLPIPVQDSAGRRAASTSTHGR